MKITRLAASNIMRLVAVDIHPEGALVTVGGKNGAGKSSAINSIAMALGGAALCPPEPIRTGEAEAFVTVDFDTDLVVTRKFSREHAACDCIVAGDTEKPKQREEDAHAQNCSILVWGETRSTLIVTNKAGASYPSPQALLNKLYGTLAFDPLAFKDAKDQAAILRALVKLDTSKFEKDRADAAVQRAMLKKTLAIKQAQLLAMPKHDDAPPEEASMDAVGAKMLDAERLRKAAEDVEREVSKSRSNGEQLERQRIRLETEVGNLQAQLMAKQDELARSLIDAGYNEEELKAKTAAAEAARAAVPDVDVIRAELAATEATNAKVRANKKHAEAQFEVNTLEQQVRNYEQAVKESDEGKAAALRAVQFPVDGLGLNDDGVTFGGLPLAQASSAEQLRVSVAIGCALNPTLKVLLVKNGNLLDEDSLAAVAKQAEEAGAQIWVEWVTKDAADVQVFIEDGHVA